MTPAERFDVAVVGGGPAGVAAALAAARGGARTLLVEREERLGGNVSHALVHTICGLYRADTDAPEPAHAGLPARIAALLRAAGGAGEPERAGRVFHLPIRPPHFAALAESLCERAPGLVVARGASLAGIELARDTASRSRLRIAGPGGDRTTDALCVIDASGDAAVAWLGGAATEMADGDTLQRPSFLFRIAGVTGSAPEGFARLQLTAPVARAARQGALAPACESLVVRSAGEPGSLYATLTLPREAGEVYAPLDAAHCEALHRRGRACAAAAVAFLRATHPAFAAAEIADWPARIGVRETRRVAGREQLARADVLAGRRRGDEVALSCWPIELWEDHRRARLEHPAGPCSIPLAALVSRTHPTLGAAGRCLSATHEALGALRVIGTALATGEAIGVAAALAADAGSALAAVDPRRVRDAIAAHAGSCPA